MEEIKLIINPFEMGTEKEAANKVQEEANEAVHAWRSLVEDEHPTSIEEKMNASIRRHVRLADEIADVIQAACNLAVRYGIDLQAAMWRCERRNRERGRYEDEDAKPCGIHDGNNCGCGGNCEAEAVIELIKDARDEYMRLRTENGIMLDELLIRQDKIDKLNQQVSDLIHERDGLRNRLAELSEAGITSLHRLLRETLGEAKNITHNARVYINKKQGSKDEHCGSRRSDRRNHGGDCGAQCAREHVLSAESTAQEMSEREKVLERLRGYAVYMAEPPSENTNRLFACITGNKDARIACVNDVLDVRDKLIELLNNGE